MKILHILDHSIPLHSGYTFRTRNILEQQRALGWETAQVTGGKHRGSSAPEEDVAGFHFYRTAPAKGWSGRTPVLNQILVVSALAARLEEVVKKEQPDILHAHSPALNGLAALRVGHRRRIPVVYECRAFWEDAAVDHGTSSEYGPRYYLTRMLESRVFRQADAVTTICEGLRSDIIRRGVPENKVTVIPNAVDIQKFSVGRPKDEGLARKLGLDKRTILGFIGSFYAYEGLPLVLQALPRIRESVPDVSLLLVGGGPQQELLQEEVNRLALQDHVVFTGRVPHEQVQQYYDLVDIFVYPRLSMRLTELVTPLKPLEAMAQGRLVLASNVGGHRELIEDRVTGYLFPANDPASLAEAVRNLLQHRADWPAMRKVARRFVEAQRNWPLSVSRYHAVYEALI